MLGKRQSPKPLLSLAPSWESDCPLIARPVNPRASAMSRSRLLKKPRLHSRECKVKILLAATAALTTASPVPRMATLLAVAVVEVAEVVSADVEVVVAALGIVAVVAALGIVAVVVAAAVVVALGIVADEEEVVVGAARIVVVSAISLEGRQLSRFRDRAYDTEYLLSKNVVRQTDTYAKVDHLGCRFAMSARLGWVACWSLFLSQGTQSTT
jgi:hypothetical protein